MRAMGSGREPRGFALLEAIVSMALIAGAGMALFSWVQQNMETAARLARQQARTQALLNAHAFAETINPAGRPDGEFSRDGWHLHWSSTVVQPLQPSATVIPGGRGPCSVGLYRVAAELVADPVDAEPLRFSILRAGWRCSDAGDLR